VSATFQPTCASSSAGRRANLAVGFHYRRCFLFGEGFDFWSWDGKYVLYQGDKYFTPTDEQLTQWLGKDQFDALGKPLAYRLPPGLLTVLALVAVVVGWLWLFPPAPLRLKRLARDRRYQEALQTYGRSLPEGSEHSPEEKEEALAAAIQVLEGQGVAPAAARVNLRLLLAEMDRQRSYELRHQAVVHEEAGEWDLAAQYYEQAARLRVDWDKNDCDFLLQCIRRVRDKQARAAGPEPE
jgi:hypothetical protein